MKSIERVLGKKIICDHQVKMLLPIQGELTCMIEQLEELRDAGLMPESDIRSFIAADEWYLRERKASDTGYKMRLQAILDQAKKRIDNDGDED